MVIWFVTSEQVMLRDWICVLSVEIGSNGNKLKEQSRGRKRGSLMVVLRKIRGKGSKPVGIGYHRERKGRKIE